MAQQNWGSLTASDKITLWPQNEFQRALLKLPRGRQRNKNSWIGLGWYTTEPWLFPGCVAPLTPGQWTVFSSCFNYGGGQLPPPKRSCFVLRSTVPVCFEGVFLHSKEEGWGRERRWSVGVTGANCAVWAAHPSSSRNSAIISGNSSRSHKCPACCSAPKQPFFSVIILVPKFSAVLLNEFRLETLPLKKGIHVRHWAGISAWKYFVLHYFTENSLFSSNGCFFKKRMDSE